MEKEEKEPKKTKLELLKMLKEEITKERSLDYLSETLELDKTEVLGLVSRLKADGNNISVTRKNKVIYVKNFGDASLIELKPYKIVTDKKTIKLGIISDTRFGSIYQQLGNVNDVYRQAKSFEVSDIFHCGDISEGVYYGRRELYNESLFLHGAYEQGKYIVNNYPYVNSIKTHFIIGEHDMSHLRNTKELMGVDIGKYISSKRDDMNYLGKVGRKIIYTDPDGNKLFDILLLHPKGKIAYTISYKPQRFIAAMRSEDKPDFLFHGHWLQAENLVYHNVREFSVPGLVATTPEMLDEGLNNTNGAWFLTIELDDKNNIERVQPLFMPYYVTSQQDYRKVKALRIEGGK